MPSWALDDVVGTLWAVREAAGGSRTSAWLGACVSSHALGARTGAALFITDVERSVSEGNWPRLKNAVKHFCGGKKKGTEGTPPRVRVPK